MSAWLDAQRWADYAPLWFALALPIGSLSLLVVLAWWHGWLDPIRVDPPPLPQVFPAFRPRRRLVHPESRLPAVVVVDPYLGILPMPRELPGTPVFDRVLVAHRLRQISPVPVSHDERLVIEP